MTLPEIKEILKTTGFPVSFGNWPEAQAPSMPYIVYTTEETNSFFADGIVYYSDENIIVDLYTNKKDLEAEQLVDNTLLHFSYTKNQAYLSDEKCWVTTYQFTNEVN